MPGSILVFGSRGVGAAVARRWCASGGNVFVCSKSAAHAAAAAAAASAAGDGFAADARAGYFACDLLQARR